MPGEREQEGEGSSAVTAAEVGGGGNSSKGAQLVVEEAAPSRASTSLDHWEAQSVDIHKTAFPVFEEDDDRGLSRTFRMSIIFGSVLMMVVVILCLVVVLPRSAKKHDKSKLSTELNILQLEAAAAAVDDVPAVIAIVCKATRFPDTCKASLLSAPPAGCAVNVTDVVDSAVEISRTAAVALRTLSQNLLKTSHNVNLTSASRDCEYLLARAASFLAKCLETPLAGQTAWQVADAQAWMSAALTYENDCRSALSYVNTTQAVDHLMGQTNYAITLTSNALSMVDAYRAHGNNTSAWAPPTRLSVFDNAVPPPEGCRDGAGSRDWWRNTAVTVATDGTGEYSSVQAAVDAAPEGATEWFTIHVREGVYKETVRIPSEKTKLALVGEGMGRTVITGNRNAQMPGVTTYDSATVAVDGDGFVAVGMTFENTAGPQKHQAVALRVDSDFSAFYNCSFLGYQDTLYVHSLRQFYRGCRIEGTIDFIFGNSAAVFQDCLILFRPGIPNVATSVVAAHGRTDPAETTALVFHKCTLNGTLPFLHNYAMLPNRHHAYLGRPWKSFSRTIFLQSNLAGFVRPEGWLPWNGTFALDTLFYGEYLSSGPGARPAARVAWSTQIPYDVAVYFTVGPVVQGDRWLPATNVPFALSL